MSRVGKRLITATLKPLAKLFEHVRVPLTRAWAHASLAARIRTPLDSTIVVQGRVEIHGTGRIHFGKDLFLYPGLYLETRGSGRIDIGEGVVISRGVHLVSYDEIVIGEGTGIGEYSSVRDANHKRGDGSSVRASEHAGKRICIGRNVWIGRGVTILPGVTIGDDAVVGANAVVSRDVAPRSVVAGVPARLLHSEVLQ